MPAWAKPMKNHLKNLSARFYPGGWSLPGDELHGEVEDAVDQEVGHDEGEDVGGGVVQHVSLRFCNIYTGLQLKRWTTVLEARRNQRWNICPML